VKPEVRQSGTGKHVPFTSAHRTDENSLVICLLSELPVSATCDPPTQYEHNHLLIIIYN